AAEARRNRSETKRRVLSESGRSAASATASASAARLDQARRRDEDRKKKALLRKNAEFQLLLDDDAAAAAVGSEAGGASNTRASAPAEKRIRARDPTGGSDRDDGNDEGNRVVKRKRGSEARQEAATGAAADAATVAEDEDELTRDIRERDEFDRRLKERDKEKTKKLVEDRSSKTTEEAQRRKLMADSADREASLDELRVLSRQQYLGKREEQRVLLLEREIRDEEELFGRERLTRAERDAMAKKKELLRIIRERMTISDKYDGYMMPEDYITEKGKLDKKKQEAALKQRYQETDESYVPDQQIWEDLQIQNAILPGTKKQAQKTDEFEFDYVFDEEQHIKFIMESAVLEAAEDADQTPKISEEERKKMEMKDIRANLPIYEFREQLLEAIEQFQVLIIVGETGSGKTTQIPQYLHETGYTKGGRKIGCTQPRRVAAMSVAARVAEEMSTKVGHEVGYSIRFEDCTSDKTVIKFMTDGMLLREFLTEPDLAGYSCLMIDEAHERTLHTDILFGLVKDIARFRKDLKLLVSSATMDAEKFSRFFDDAPIFHIKGRKFPVTTYYTQAPEADYLAAAITTIMTIHVTEPPGDILLFLTGQDEIEQAEQHLLFLAKQLGSKIAELKICPIYSTLPSEKQAEIFEPTPPGARKVVLATNIAETSITIDGIVYVVDPGFVKQKSFNPKTGMESLVVVPASRAAANQRKGRAGRVRPGKCFRLYTSWAFQNELDDNTVPEIQRTNLANVVLLLKVIGINDLRAFDFLDAPPRDTLMKALELLYALGALNSRGELTKLGRRMAEFPTDPMLSKALVASERYRCSEDVVSVVAMLSAGNAIFFRPKADAVQADQARRNFFRPGGDHITLLAVWDAWVETNYSVAWCRENYIQHRSMKRARDVRDQLVGLMDRTEVALVSNADAADTAPIRKAIAAGFFPNSARLQPSGDAYRTARHNQSVLVHPSSSMYIAPSARENMAGKDKERTYPGWVVYHELVFTSREFMRQVIEIQPEWLLEVAPHYYKPDDLEPAGGSRKKMPKKAGKAALPAGLDNL
ncbi:hypothetical protein HK405_007923, partial [Cladochytrium tenue]